jgi:hypothetical protein
MGVGFLGLGFQPKWPLSDIPIMPKVFLSLNLINVVFKVCSVPTSETVEGSCYYLIYIPV